MSDRAAIHFSPDAGVSLKEFITDQEAGAVVEIPPGRYVGTLRIRKPLTLRGAGDLTRIIPDGQDSAIRVHVGEGGSVTLDSLALEGGGGECGGGLLVESGKVEANNLHISRCRATQGGGAVCVSGGDVTLSRVRIEHVEAGRGGAIRVCALGALTVVDAQIQHAQAELGGAISVEDGARATLERVTVSRCRATSSSGGQAFYVGGSEIGTPWLRMKRVRLIDAALWSPLVHDPERPGEVYAEACDMPKLVLRDTELVDAGDNLWR